MSKLNKNKRKPEDWSSEELNRLSHNGVGRAIIRQPKFKLRVEVDKKTKSKRTKHKGRMFEDE